MGFYTVHRDLFETKGSGLTSEVHWIGDAINDTLVVTVEGDSDSTLDVEVSNANGRDAAIVEATWSTHSQVVDAAAIKYIDDVPDGTRWIRGIRTESGVSMQISYQAYA